MGQTMSPCGLRPRGVGGTAAGWLDGERALYNRLYRCIEQLARSPEGAMAKDIDQVMKRWERDVAKMLPNMDPAVVLAELKTCPEMAPRP